MPSPGKEIRRLGGGRMKKRSGAPKMSGLVVAALRNLRDAHGSTAKEIMKYIMAEYNASEAVVQRQLRTALKRGVEYGILKKTTNGYSLNTDAEVIGPLDLAQMDSCGKKKKRMSCKPKRKACPRKKKRASCPTKKKKRASCSPKKKRKPKNPCGMCAARGRKGDCSPDVPVQMVRQPSTVNLEDEDDDANMSPNERSADGSTGRPASSRSVASKEGRRSRSQSEAAMSRYSGSENEDENLDYD